VLLESASSSVLLTAGLLDGDATYLYPVLAGMLVLGTAVGLDQRPRRHRLALHPLIVTSGMGADPAGLTLLYAMGRGVGPGRLRHHCHGTFGPFRPPPW